MCCPGEDYVLLANVAQKLGAFHSFLGLLLSTATLQFLSPKRALRVHGLRYRPQFLVGYILRWIPPCVAVTWEDAAARGARASTRKDMIQQWRPQGPSRRRRTKAGGQQSFEGSG